MDILVLVFARCTYGERFGQVESGQVGRPDWRRGGNIIWGILANTVHPKTTDDACDCYECLSNRARQKAVETFIFVMRTCLSCCMNRLSQNGSCPGPTSDAHACICAHVHDAPLRRQVYWWFCLTNMSSRLQPSRHPPDVAASLCLSTASSRLIQNAREGGRDKGTLAHQPGKQRKKANMNGVTGGLVLLFLLGGGGDCISLFWEGVLV